MAKLKVGRGRKKKKASERVRGVSVSLPPQIYFTLSKIGPNPSAAARTVLLDWWNGLQLKGDGVQ